MSTTQVFHCSCQQMTDPNPACDHWSILQKPWDWYECGFPLDFNNKEFHAIIFIFHLLLLLKEITFFFSPLKRSRSTLLPLPFHHNIISTSCLLTSSYSLTCGVVTNPPTFQPPLASFTWNKLFWKEMTKTIVYLEYVKVGCVNEAPLAPIVLPLVRQAFLSTFFIFHFYMWKITI